MTMPGTSSPLSERFNESNQDIRYSLPSDDVLDQQIRGYLSGILGDYGQAPSGTEQGSISADRAAPAGSTPRGTQTGPIKSGQEIMQTLGERLGLPMDTRRKKYMRQLRNSTRGYTRRNTGIQHIQDAQNIRTAMHELGHTLLLLCIAEVCLRNKGFVSLDRETDSEPPCLP